MVYTEQREKEDKTKDKGGRIDSREISAKKILEMEEGVWKGRV